MSKSFGEIARHPARFGVILALGLLALVVGVMNASAVHDNGLFELDRDATAGGAPGDDWNTLAGGGGSADDFTGIVNDPAATDTSIFTTGGSKDDLDVNQWQHSSGSVPDKDQILHAYGASYTNPADGHNIIYYGLDRFANNGAADLGFWFFQNEITTTSSAFTGVHAARVKNCTTGVVTSHGDILIVFEFTNGGAFAAARVLEWVGPGGACTTGGVIDRVDGNGSVVILRELNSTAVPPESADCVGPPSVGAQDAFCATGNIACTNVPAVAITDALGSPVTGTWASTYSAKFPGSCTTTPKQFAISSFFEGGIDINAIFGEGVCFTSFLAMTRTSPTVRAQLKDFVLASLDTCATQPTTVTEIHNGAVHTAVLSVPAGSTVHDQATVTPSGAFTPTGTVDFTFFTNGTCTGTGTPAGSATLNASGVAHPSTSQGPLTVGFYSFRAHYNGDARNLPSDSACEPLQVVDAQIDLSPLTDTNAVNDPHTITCAIQQDDGLPAGAPGDATTGFGPAPNGTTCTLSLLNNTAGATFVGGVNTCTTTAGSCTVQINTSTAGSVDIHATTTFSVGGVSLTRATGTGGLNSADANKVYVDAQIDLSPLTDTNPIFDVHTITATVQQDDGLPTGAPADAATGFGPAPNGTCVVFTLLNNTANATFTTPDDGNSCGGTASNLDDCLTAGGLGTCTINITASTAGSVDIHATTTFSVGGVSLTRATGTGGLNSADANKVFQDAAIMVLKRSTKTGAFGSPKLVTQPGAVFSVDGPDTGTAADFTVKDNNTPGDPGSKLDEGPTIGEICISGLEPGNYTVTEIAPPSGYSLPPVVADRTDTAGAVATTNCTTNQPSIGDSAIFKNPPLFDIEVNFRDGGSGETSLIGDIVCDDDNNPATPYDPTETTTTTGWDESARWLGKPAPVIIVCTINVDP